MTRVMWIACVLCLLSVAAFGLLQNGEVYDHEVAGYGYGFSSIVVNGNVIDDTDPPTEWEPDPLEEDTYYTPIPKDYDWPFWHWKERKYTDTDGDGEADEWVESEHTKYDPDFDGLGMTNSTVTGWGSVSRAG